jgi:hypothetical protein
MSVSDYTGLDDDAELQRYRDHQADDLDVTLDRESEAGRDHNTRALFWRWYAGVVLLAVASIAVIFWPQIAAVLKEISK